MRRSLFAALLVLSAFTTSVAQKDKPAPDWKVGRVMDENRAKEFVGVLHDNQSSTTSSGTVNGTAQTTEYGNSSNTDFNGSYTGSSSTSSYGIDRPLYKVYENLIIEDDDMVYVTSERLWFRWSKGPHLTVNSEVKFYVEGLKLHLIDNTGKEKTIGIIKQIGKTPSIPPLLEAASVAPSVATTSLAATLAITSTPIGADIEVDGSFVGNTPSSIALQQGDHVVKLTKTGYQSWERKLRTSTGTVTISPEMQKIENPPPA